MNSRGYQRTDTKMPRGGGSRCGGRSHGFRGHFRRRRLGRRSGGGVGLTRDQIPTAIFTAIFIILIALSVSLFSSIDSGHLLLSPGDSRLVNFSANCRQLTLTDKSKTTTASVYLITETPPLTLHNTFTIKYSSLTIGKAKYEYWQYHFYPKSSFNMTTCSASADSSGVLFLIIKGKTRFSKWSKGRNVENELQIQVVNSCGNRHLLDFTAHEEDEYFFVFFNPGNIAVEVDVKMSFECWEYSPPPQTVEVPFCSVSSSESCSLQVSSGHSYRALIVTDVPVGVDWEENVEVSWSCNSLASLYLNASPGSVTMSSTLVCVVMVTGLTALGYMVCLWSRQSAESIQTLPPSSTSQNPLPLSPPSASQDQLSSSDSITSENTM